MTSSSLINPFPDPDDISPLLNNEVKREISKNFKNSKNKSMSYHDLVEKFEELLDERKHKDRASIFGYYCANAILGSSKVPETEKKQAMNALYLAYIDCFSQLNDNNLTQNNTKNFFQVRQS